MSVHSLVASLGLCALSPLSGAPTASVVSQVAPVYSRDLRTSGVEGEVVVGFTISPKGEVVDPVVVSATQGALVAPTLQAVRKWKFTPATENGVAVSVKAMQSIEFVIPELHPENAPRLVASKPKTSG
jgi:protein TonB